MGSDAGTPLDRPDPVVVLYDALADRLHHYLQARLGASADADDVLQETFVRLARNHESLTAADDPAAFAFAVARNEANRWLDARRRRGEVAAAASASGLFVEADSDDADAREAAEVVARALARLDDADREIVELKAYSGLTFRAIAAVVGRPQGTVAGRYQAALGRMRAFLAKEVP